MKRSDQRFEDVSPAQDTFQTMLVRGDGQAGDFLLQHERGGGVERRGGAYGDGVARHDLMRAFVEGGSIAIRFGHRADVRAEGFQ